MRKLNAFEFPDVLKLAGQDVNDFVGVLVPGRFIMDKRTDDEKELARYNELAYSFRLNTELYENRA